MKIKRIQNVTNYCVTNNNLFLANKDRIIKSLNSELEFNEFKFDGASMFADGDFLIIPVNPSQTFIFDLVKNVYELLDFNIVFKSNYRNKVLVTKTSNDGTHYFISQYDLIQKKITYTSRKEFSSWNGDLIGNSYYDIDENQIIHSFHLPTEITLWQYSVADLGAEKVSKILGVFGQTLVVVGQIKENTFVLFGLDVQSGQLLWKHDTVFERNSDGRISRVKLNLPYADTTSNKIIIFEAGFYIEIEGSSGQILKWIDVFKSPFHYNDLTMDAFAFDISQADEEHIYFRTSVPTYGMYTGAGIFNRKTDKLEFLEIIKNEKGNPVIIGPLKIQATKEKYYVLDTQNTLHIFEREDETPDLNQ